MYFTNVKKYKKTYEFIIGNNGVCKFAIEKLERFDMCKNLQLKNLSGLTCGNNGVKF